MDVDDPEEDAVESGSESGGEQEEPAPGAAEDMFFNDEELEDFLEQAEMDEAGVRRAGADSDDEEAAYEYVYGTGAKDEDDGLDSGYSDEEDEKQAKQSSKKRGGAAVEAEDEEEEDPEDFGAMAKFSDFFGPPRYARKHFFTLF